MKVHENGQRDVLEANDVQTHVLAFVVHPKEDLRLRNETRVVHMSTAR
jgi:hypothetical protein